MFLKHLISTLSKIPEAIVNNSIYFKKSNGEMYVDIDDKRMRINPHADWDETDENSLTYIENKPTFGTVTSHDVVTTVERSNNIPTANAVYSALRSVESDFESLKAAYGAPLLARGIAEMTHTDRIYVYTGSENGMQTNHWYYFNGTKWVPGGVYSSHSVTTDKTLLRENVPADAKAVGDVIDELENALLVTDTFFYFDIVNGRLIQTTVREDTTKEFKFVLQEGRMIVTYV